MPVIKVCDFCKAEFSVQPKRSDTARFCSIECSKRSRGWNPESTVDCAHCGSSFYAKPCINSESTPIKRKAKFCSRKCKFEYHGWSNSDNQICTQCREPFHIKQSQVTRFSRSHGVFCSNVCYAKFKKVAYLAENNPNHKGKNTDADGYRKYVSSAGRLNGFTATKLHTAICAEIIGVKSIKGFNIHHRDCNIENNEPENLVILENTDHRWLHKQFGVATLWAFMHGKIDINSLCEWSDDKERALRLLPLSVLNQTASEIGNVVDDCLSPKEVVKNDVNS